LKGPRFERKRYALAVHYRNLPEEDVPAIERVVREVVSRFPELRVTGGKKIFELRPALDWDKGKAVLWLLEALGMSLVDELPVYIGDDVTDEDAFRALADGGFGIRVGKPSAVSAARGRLADVFEVESFLSELSHLPEPVR
jgi:alpha,alpha-trehalase